MLNLRRIYSEDGSFQWCDCEPGTTRVRRVFTSNEMNELRYNMKRVQKRQWYLSSRHAGLVLVLTSNPKLSDYELDRKRAANLLREFHSCFYPIGVVIER